MVSTTSRVVIGMDPHKQSGMIEVMGRDETVLGSGRFGTDRESYAAMRREKRDLVRHEVEVLATLSERGRTGPRPLVAQPRWTKR